MFQRLNQRGRTSVLAAEPRATFAAFGKHPGWDDHMPDIGVVTETLVSLKQSLYINGIGGQINSGAWERLEPEKRIEGFDHIFLSVLQGQCVLGQLWSSTDRKGRSKYPMAVCVHLENLPLGALLEKPSPVLDQARDGCKATTSPNHVILECQMAQDQLSAWLGASGPKPGQAAPSLEQKRRFLKHPAFQPDSQGLLRVLHELDNATGRSHGQAFESNGAADLRPYHTRVPLCSESPVEALLLWVTFLRCVLTDSVPLLLMARYRSDWLDVIIGQPGGEDLFCLQASLKALPLATAIPYDLSPDLGQHLHRLTEALLGPEPPGRSAGQVSGATNGPPSAEMRPESAPRLARSPRGRTISLSLGAVVLAVSCLALGFWLRPKLAPVLLGNGRGADEAGAASAIKTGDSQAAQLREAAAQRIALAKAETEREQKYQAAMKAGRAALDRHDSTRAMAQADAALAIKAGDSQAAQLKEAAAQQIALAKVETERDQNYQAAMNTGQAALDRHDYTQAIAQADAALAIKAGDSQAVQLKEGATQQIAAAKVQTEREQKYQTAMKAGRAALDRHDSTQAIAQADAALGLKANDVEAGKLKVAARQEQAYQGAVAAFGQGDYAKALSLCQPFQGTERFDQLARQISQEQGQVQALQKGLNEGSYADILQSSWPDKAPFNSLKAQALQENRVLQQAREQLAAGDYAFVEALAQQSFTSKAPFLAVLESGRKERDALASLQSLRKADQHDATRRELAKLPAAIRSKKPFVEVEKWAAINPDGAQQASPAPPGLLGTAARFENVLQALEVRFGLKEEGPTVLDSDDNPVKRETNLTKAKRSEAMAKVRYLRESRSDGWLTEERKVRLQKVDDAIRNWKE
jgi:hypothetical protein